MIISTTISSGSFYTDSTIVIADISTPLITETTGFAYVYIAFTATSVSSVVFTYDNSYNQYGSIGVLKLNYGGAQNKYAMRFKMDKSNQSLRTSSFQIRVNTNTSAVYRTTSFSIEQKSCGEEYVINFVNHNGTVLQTGTVIQGVMPSYTGSTPTRAQDAQYNYTFTGWSPAIVTASSDATYTAQYSGTTRAYTITWYNDGTLLETDNNVPYGTTPTYNGATPTMQPDPPYEHTFTGWSPSVSTVTSDTRYYAQFEKRLVEFEVLFDTTGTLLDPDNPVHDPSDPSYDPNIPDWPNNTVTVNSGDTVSDPRIPITGYTVEWYSDTSYQNLWDFNTVIGSDVKLYAKLVDNTDDRLRVRNVRIGGTSLYLDSCWSGLSIEYSTDGGKNWVQFTPNTSVQVTDVVYLRGKIKEEAIAPKSEPLSGEYTHFQIDGQASVEGNINYLWDSEDLSKKLYDYCGYKLFEGNIYLISASRLTIPTADAIGCYESMFSGCTNLASAPSLDETNKLGEKCYKGMFENCTSLTKAPALMAAQCSDYCYEEMFKDCASLNEITCNLALADAKCTRNWVSGVTSQGVISIIDCATWSALTYNDGIPKNFNCQEIK